MTKNKVLDSLLQVIYELIEDLIKIKQKRN